MLRASMRTSSKETGLLRGILQDYTVSEPRRSEPELSLYYEPQIFRECRVFQKYLYNAISYAIVWRMLGKSLHLRRTN
jgi:hypothetical protein